ncbi:MAG: ATP-binding protein, partial [Chloroflexota bacterium]
IEALVAQFDLGTQGIAAAGVQALGEPAQRLNGGLGARLWDACRAQARPRLDDLAQRIEPAATWDDLVLPEAQRQVLREIAIHVRQRARVYETWGFAAKSARGLGISALFAGPSGTGKTMAAEVLAHELRLDLYRIDLSSVVSKYIGETEKNLRRVFDAAEAGGAILLFDEADALFGKRSEVKDSHDRYANIEISYLLQRMEAYRGLAILTTNLKSALDTAFLRRLRFVVQFPFPDAAQRAEIWQRVFPADTPTAGLDPSRLARLNVAGGNIRNIAMNAAFLAADAGEPVQMTHLLRAARSEYAKLDKALTDAEIGGWV